MVREGKLLWDRPVVPMRFDERPLIGEPVQALVDPP
jgi:hypothetical protein